MKKPPLEVRVTSVCMADGTDINSPEAQTRIALGLLSGTPRPTDPAQQRVQQPAKVG